MCETATIIVQPNVIEQKIFVEPRITKVIITPETTTAALRGAKGNDGVDGINGTVRTPLSFPITEATMTLQSDDLIGEMDLHVFIDGAHQSFAFINARHNKTTGTIDFTDDLGGLAAGSIVDIEKYTQP